VTLSATQVQLRLCDIAYSQDSVGGKVHRPTAGGKFDMSSVTDEVKRLKEQAKAVGDEEEAARKFQKEFGTIGVGLVFGDGTGQVPNQWYSMDNRRLAIMKGALGGETSIVANIATRQEMLNMVGLNEGRDKQWGIFEELYGKGDGSELREFMNGNRTKWSTKDGGETIRVRGQRPDKQ